METAASGGGTSGGGSSGLDFPTPAIPDLSAEEPLFATLAEEQASSTPAGITALLNPDTTPSPPLSPFSGPGVLGGKPGAVQVAAALSAPPALQPGSQGSIRDILYSVAATLAQRYGVDPHLLFQIALATANQESGGNPHAVGDNGTSFGLFQLHEGGELGRLSKQQAFDPWTNAMTAMTVIAQTMKSHPGMTAGQIAAAAQRPANGAAYAKGIDDAIAAAAKTNGEVALGSNNYYYLNSLYQSQQGAGGAGGAGGSLPPTPTTIGALGIAAAQKEFPELAWMLSVPNIASDISTWAAGNYSPDQIAARLAGTAWYQRLGSTFFTWIAQQATNPAQAKQTLDEARAAITQSFQQMGLQPTQSQIDTFAYQYLAQDWQAHPELANQALADTIAANPDGTFSVKNYTLGPNGQLQNTFVGPNGQQSLNPADFQTTLDPSAIQNGFVSQFATWGQPGWNIDANAPIYVLKNGKLTQGVDLKSLAPGTPLYTLPNLVAASQGPATGPESNMSGMLQTAEQAANQAAGDYLVPFSGQQAAQLVQQSVQAGLSGQALADHFKTYFQEQAKSLYPSMAGAIDAGITPRAYAAPYQSVVSRLLGVTPDQVDMTDPKYMRFLTQKDPKTGVPIAMSLYDAQQLVMSDPVYGYKKSPDFANRASALAQGIGEMFGKTTSSVPQGFSGVAAPALPL